MSMTRKSTNLSLVEEASKLSQIPSLVLRRPIFSSSLFLCQSFILNCTIITIGKNIEILSVFYSLLAASEIEDENIVMYVGLIVAIFVFITVVIIIIILLRRKTQQNGVYDYCKPYTYAGIIHSAQRNTVKQNHVVKICVQSHLVVFLAKSSSFSVTQKIPFVVITPVFRRKYVFIFLLPRSDNIFFVAINAHVYLFLMGISNAYVQNL